MHVVLLKQKCARSCRLGRLLGDSFPGFGSSELLVTYFFFSNYAGGEEYKMS